MKSAFTSLCLLAGTSLTSAFTFKSETIVATLDDLHSTTPGATAYHAHPEVGIYNQLLWHGFSVDTPPGNLTVDDDDFQGCEPHTSPNYASAPVVRDFILPGLSTNYVGSNVVFFDLDKFYWGCSTTDPKNAGKLLPGWCSLEILAYAHNSLTPTARASSFYFPKTGARRMELLYAGLPTSFKAITRVEFKVDADTANPVLYIDDVQFNVYEVTDMGSGLGEIVHQQAAVAGGNRRVGGGRGVEVPGGMGGGEMGGF